MAQTARRARRVRWSSFSATETCPRGPGRPIIGSSSSGWRVSRETGADDAGQSRAKVAGELTVIARWLRVGDMDQSGLIIVPGHQLRDQIPQLDIGHGR